MYASYISSPRARTRVLIPVETPRRRTSMINLNATGHEGWGWGGRRGDTQRDEVRARTRVWYLSCPTNAFKYRIWSTLSAIRRWDCASVIFSVLHSARVVFLVFPAAHALVFLYILHLTPQFSAFIPPSFTFLTRLISSYTYTPPPTSMCAPFLSNSNTVSTK